MTNRLDDWWRELLSLPPFEGAHEGTNWGPGQIVWFRELAQGRSVNGIPATEETRRRAIQILIEQSEIQGYKNVWGLKLAVWAAFDQYYDHEGLVGFPPQHIAMVRTLLARTCGVDSDEYALLTPALLWEQIKPSLRDQGWPIDEFEQLGDDELPKV